MIVETRKTRNGTEYWDAKEKRVRFVPEGNTPNFEVTDNPPSMLMGVDLTTGKDITVVNELPDGPITQFSNMTIKELREYAKENKIVIPTTLKKQEEIVTFLNNETLAEGELIEDDEE
ncbi:hypothetical protein A0U40_05320 [[Bacillus] sp. KCTC 13219]|nr:hypothetical protein A0U40_05320 [[Bacillus] sp. KCTC 13219]